MRLASFLFKKPLKIVDSFLSWSYNLFRKLKEGGNKKLSNKKDVRNFAQILKFDYRKFDSENLTAENGGEKSGGPILVHEIKF